MDYQRITNELQRIPMILLGIPLTDFFMECSRGFLGINKESLWSYQERTMDYQRITNVLQGMFMILLGDSLEGFL